MHLVPDVVVNAVSSPRGVVVPLRRATRKSASSTGAAASTQAIASPAGAPGSGADAEGAGVDVEAMVLLLLVVAVVPAVRDGVIGVSWVAPGWPAGCWEHPATSADAASNTAIRIRQG
jgi:hypothetical protein